jgi:hypothetical protein
MTPYSLIWHLIIREMRNAFRILIKMPDGKKIFGKLRSKLK